MKTLKCLLAGIPACVLLLLAQSAFAHRITGDITIVGDPWVKSDTGDFATFVTKGSVVTSTKNNLRSIMTDPSFFWTVNGFTFNSTSLTSSTSSMATGTGMTSGNGFAPTGGSWTLTGAGTSGSVFSFTAAPRVPDRGSTFGLFSLALVALVSASRLRSIRLA
jgi:hypothetical protein